MAKKPMRISEILAKKSTGTAQVVPANDFIAESQKIISQYSKGAQASEPGLALKDSAVEERTAIDAFVPTNERGSLETALNAPEVPTLSADITPTNDIPNSNTEPLNRSKTNSNSSETVTELLRNDSVTNEEQFRNNTVTVTKQLRNDSVTFRNATVTNAKLLRNDSVTDSVTHSVIVTEQLRNDSVTPIANPPHVNRLSGNKLSIIETIFHFCQERGSTNSGPVSRDIFESKTGIEGEVIRVTCHRLMKDGYLKILESKRGNGGYTIYELHPITHSQLVSGYLRNNSVTPPERFRNTSVTDSVTDNVTISSSKLDSKNNINLTNLTQPTLNPWFKDLDFSKVSPIGPMQVNSTIRHLVQEKLNPEDVQNFLNRFTSWMATQTKISSPLGMFCEKLKEFANEGDSPILYSMTEDERQIEAQFAAQVEKARAEMQLINKAREQSKLKQKEESFESWFQNASEEEMINLFKPNAIAKLGSPSYKLGLKAVYMESEIEGS